jgi:hypothetical protein
MHYGLDTLLIRIGADTTSWIAILAMRSRYLHPGDASRMSEWAPTGFRLPCRGLFSGSGMVGRRGFLLARRRSPTHSGAMFSVDETTAEAIRQVFEKSGELSAVVELRRHFPGITNNETARICVRAIAGWKPLPTLPQRRTRTCRTRSSTQ